MKKSILTILIAVFYIGTGCQGGNLTNIETPMLVEETLPPGPVITITDPL